MLLGAFETKTFIRVVKLTSVILLSACLVTHARGYSQKVTLDEKNVPLDKVFKEIKKQTGYVFFYNETLLENAKKVTINIRDASLEQALEICFQDQPITYTIVGNNIVIKQRETLPVAPSTIQGNTAPPPTDISGRITNEQGEPLAGASVIIKRTGGGDIADAKGNFKLKDVTSDDIIQISFAGYKTQNIKVGKITSFTIVMEVATNDLDKVVVQAYGTTTQRMATGSIVTVTKEQIERQPVMNPLAALEGQVPGLVIQQINGYASAPFKAEIRGRSVIDATQPSEPLYIVDGVPLTVLNLGNANYNSGSFGFVQSGLTGPAGGQSPFFSINPQDIESITILKDADATAIYGSRGANGVIIINTKKGQSGKMDLEANLYEGFSKVTGRYDLLNTQQYLRMREEALKNDGIPMDAGNAYDLVTWDTSRYTDWQRYYWGGTGHTTDVDLSLAGGDKLNSFRFSGSYHKETNIFTRSGSDQRGSVNFNYGYKNLNQRLTISLTSIYSYTQSDLLSLGGSVLEAPNAPAPFNSQGYLNWQGWDPVPGNLTNFGTLLQPYKSKTGFLNGQLEFRYEIIRGLNLSTQFGYSSMHNSQSQLIPIISQNPLINPKGQSNFGNSNSTNTIVEPQIEYKKLFGKHKLDVLIGASTQSVASDGNIITGSGYVNDNLLNSVSNAPIKTANDGSGQYKYSAIFSRVSYSYNNKYLINLSARRDGSSRFGSGRQFGNFGALGVGWIFTQENWFKNHFSTLSFGKIRGSYGLTGFDGFSDYVYLTRWSASNSFPYQNIPTYLPLQHANPELVWETNYKLEAALDLGFFTDRLTLEAAFYRNRCGNQLINYVLPNMTGFNFIFANSPATIQNAGIELQLKGIIIENKDFSWSVNFNIGTIKNKLISFPDLDKSPYASAISIGQSLNIVRMLHYTGVNPQTGEYTFEDKNHNNITDYSYNNGDNDLYNKDLSVKYDGGFGTDIQYKKILLNLVFIFRKQELQSAIYNSNPGALETNQSVQVLDRWQKPGDNAKFARYTTQPQLSDILFYRSDGVYSNGSFLRMRNISLAYDLPARLLTKLRIGTCKIYARGENLLTFTTYNGVDPEAPGLGTLPPAKVFVCGIQFNL